MGLLVAFPLLNQTGDYPSSCSFSLFDSAGATADSSVWLRDSLLVVHYLTPNWHICCWKTD